MKPRILVCALATAASFSLVAPASGQIQSYNDTAAACAAGEDCEALVASAISQLQQSGLSTQDLEAQLGLLAGALADAADGLPLARRIAIANSLMAIAQASPDPSQARMINAVAIELESSGPRATEPFGSSDS